MISLFSSTWTSRIFIITKERPTVYVKKILSLLAKLVREVFRSPLVTILSLFTKVVVLSDITLSDESDLNI